MKKTLFLLAFLAYGFFASAQIYVEGVKLGPDNTGQYIELDPMYRTDGQCSFTVDFGQSNPKEDHVTDSTGKRYDFISLVDGLNFFYANGWEVAQISVLKKAAGVF